MDEQDNKNGMKIILNKSTNPNARGTYFICFTMVLFPDSPAPVGTQRGGKTGECQLRGMGRGFKACEGWALLGTQWCQLRDQVSRGARRVGKQWPGSRSGGGYRGPYPAGVISRLWRR